jgi:hypothetical protein
MHCLRASSDTCVAYCLRTVGFPSNNTAYFRRQEGLVRVMRRFNMVSRLGRQRSDWFSSWALENIAQSAEAAEHNSDANLYIRS